jgi:hypothetical protein
MYIPRSPLLITGTGRTASLLNFSPNSITVLLISTVSFRVLTIAHPRQDPNMVWRLYSVHPQSLVVSLGGDIPKQTDSRLLP